MHRRGKTNDMWEINKQFIKTQWDQGKEFLFSHNSYNATNSFLKEVNYLKELGVKEFVSTSDGLWKAIK